MTGGATLRFGSLAAEGLTRDGRPQTVSRRRIDALAEIPEISQLKHFYTNYPPAVRELSRRRLAGSRRPLSPALAATEHVDSLVDSLGRNSDELKAFAVRISNNKKYKIVESEPLNPLDDHTWRVHIEAYEEAAQRAGQRAEREHQLDDRISRLASERAIQTGLDQADGGVLAAAVDEQLRAALVLSHEDDIQEAIESSLRQLDYDEETRAAMALSLQPVGVDEATSEAIILSKEIHLAESADRPSWDTDGGQTTLDQWLNDNPNNFVIRWIQDTGGLLNETYILENVDSIKKICESNPEVLDYGGIMWPEKFPLHYKEFYICNSSSDPRQDCDTFKRVANVPRLTDGSYTEDNSLLTWEHLQTHIDSAQPPLEFRKAWCTGMDDTIRCIKIRHGAGVSVVVKPGWLWGDPLEALRAELDRMPGDCRQFYEQNRILLSMCKHTRLTAMMQRIHERALGQMDQTNIDQQQHYNKRIKNTLSNHYRRVLPPRGVTPPVELSGTSRVFELSEVIKEVPGLVANTVKDHKGNLVSADHCNHAEHITVYELQPVSDESLIQPVDRAEPEPVDLPEPEPEPEDLPEKFLDIYRPGKPSEGEAPPAPDGCEEQANNLGLCRLHIHNVEAAFQMYNPGAEHKIEEVSKAINLAMRAVANPAERRAAMAALRVLSAYRNYMQGTLDAVTKDVGPYPPQ